MLDSSGNSALPQAASNAPANDPVQDVAGAQFMAAVVEASKTKLILADFWAPWCAPCKTLGPVLEKLVRAHKGAVTLAKVNIDEAPAIAGHLQIKSIPAVLAFYQGQVVDGFMGALPEKEVEAWIARLLHATGAGLPEQADPGPQEVIAQAAKALEEGDTDFAQALYADVLKRMPENPAAYAGALRCLVAKGEAAHAQELLDRAPPEIAKDKTFEQVRTEIALALDAKDALAQKDDLAARVAANPKDHEARFDLAMALFASGQKPEAIDQLLELIRRDRHWRDDAARLQLVKFFEALGPTNPLTISSRKTLSSILFS